jgi:hypothetical protein
MKQTLRHIALFLGPEMEDENRRAREILRDIQDQVEIEEVTFLGAKQSLFMYPFIRDEQENIPYYGLSGIAFFIRRFANHCVGS